MEKLLVLSFELKEEKELGTKAQSKKQKK